MKHNTQYSLKEHNTFGIDVRCQHYFSVENEQALQNLLTDPAFTSLKESYPDFLVIGGASNILFTEDVNGIVLKISIEGVTIKEETDEYVIVRVGAGVEWHYFVEFAVAQHWGGIENLSCIPGSVGAAPIQNIGAYGVEVSRVIETVDAYNIALNQFESFNKEECHFGYRESFFKMQGQCRYIITSVDFKLTKKHVLHLEYGAIKEELKNLNIENPTIAAVSRVVCAIRSSKLPQPKQIGNAGSFFKNPVVDSVLMGRLRSKHPDVPYHVFGRDFKVPAGWLIEKAGWKGYREGDAGCHEKQALVLVNHGKATGKEILALSKKIQKDVFQKFGIELASEVNIFLSNHQ